MGDPSLRVRRARGGHARRDLRTRAAFMHARKRDGPPPCVGGGPSRSCERRGYFLGAAADQSDFFMSVPLASSKAYDCFLAEYTHVWMRLPSLCHS